MPHPSGFGRGHLPEGCGTGTGINPSPPLALRSPPAEFRAPHPAGGQLQRWPGVCRGRLRRHRAISLPPTEIRAPTQPPAPVVELARLLPLGSHGTTGPLWEPPRSLGSAADPVTWDKKLGQEQRAGNKPHRPQPVPSVGWPEGQRAPGPTTVPIRLRRQGKRDHGRVGSAPSQDGRQPQALARHLTVGLSRYHRASQGATPRIELMSNGWAMDDG